MHLTYRGMPSHLQNIGYESASSEAVGMYRGARTFLQMPRHVRPTKGKGAVQFTYRGASSHSP